MKNIQLLQTLKTTIAAILITGSTLMPLHASPLHKEEIPNNSTITPPLCSYYDGSNLVIAANDGSGTEMCYWFKKCMNNKLFTFFRVGARNVSRNYSDTDGIANSQVISWLNSTGSDNIGPVSIKGYGDFVGGNHRWRTPDENGNPGKGTYTDTRTANCDRYSVYIDGEPIRKNVKSFSNNVTIRVRNTIFDPLIEPEALDEVLSSPLITEDVYYTVNGNSIAVDLDHTYLKPVTVNIYYGMQSMFVNEDSIMTPGGAFPAFVSQANANTFTKNDYPTFGRYVEHNSNNWCQSSWMRPKDLGTHYAIGNNCSIFKRNSGKCYHVIMNNNPMLQGDKVSWHGIYTWAEPLVNDSDLLVYKGVIDGREALYIDVKRACDRTIGYEGASKMRITDYTNYVNDAIISLNDDSISISAQSPASFILIPRSKGDINANGIIDVSDVNEMINMCLRLQSFDVYADMNNNGIIDVEDINTVINIILKI